MGTSTTNQSAMTFQEALKAMRKGEKVRLPEWRGYWFMDKKEKVFALTKDGDVADAWVSQFMSRDDFEIARGCDFGWAITALKAGKLVARKGWNGKGMFVFIRPADELTTGFISKVRSLPDSVKQYIDKHIDDKANPGEAGLTPVKFTAYLCMKNAQGEIMNGWSATQTDMLAEDWELFKVEETT